MAKLQKHVGEDIEKCEIKYVMYGKRKAQQLHVYTDDQKRFGYIFGGHDVYNYRCLGCVRKHFFLTSTVKQVNGKIQSVVRHGNHICSPVLLQVPPLPKKGTFRRIENWSTDSKGIDALKWLASIFAKFGHSSVSMSAAYFLSLARPTADPAVILSNKVYDGYSSCWIQRAYGHLTHGGWNALLKDFDIYMYPFMIDESQVCEEFEALGIALFYAGSLPEFMVQNKRAEKFKLFDEERGVYVLEEIATNPSHPEHEKLVLAYKQYHINAVNSQSLKANAIDLRDAAQFAPNPVTERVTYWK